MVKSFHDKKTLHNGVQIPYVGLGVYKMEDKREAMQSVLYALQSGYRLIDTASFYQNEDSVGEAIKQSSIPREELFITTKVWNDEQGYDSTLKAFERSLKQLNMDYIDLYLIHWPRPDTYLETWKALERLYDEGVVKAIGVSNFKEHHLETLFAHANEKPVINQVELHPYLTQKPLIRFCTEHEIAIEAWSPIARGRLLNHELITQLAEKYEKSPAQIILRWHLQNDVIIIPKSVHESRIEENKDLFAFTLTSEDMKQIDQLNEDHRFGKDPDHFDW
ncbi:aldo/keto reductase [Heyndrickxia ginsengihumi]|uniref:Aldo/keto reductase n=1 Tax=Heyndrickxia ginsengihumi TaxID=363870 RepID=A0A0A6V955_9BACI|nr:aldo/keto reductase [Heyndrickxia ginsengihumi]KHD84121.1 glyoxal reductase [Heyndrickxia ginsengihumi]MBE6184737.1 aldo/keto reductase [Bacillus sp. (in: firmicutes)]MCM3022977.1 aldo/keto reductase [Heyndrickxia ginsengihumi]NEY19448.1 aldo/keto reductase [Heyndrickxia ginsengihumi]